MLSKFPSSWTNEHEQFDWIETFIIDEVPLNDVWDNFATKARLELDAFHRSKGVVKECTKHYMAFEPELDGSFAEVLDNFKNTTYSYNFLKLTGSYCLPMHFDCYSTFVKRNNISEDQAHLIKRTAILVTPWKPGQVIQIEEQMISCWQPGSAYTWQGAAWHGASNFGFDDMVVLQVTWL
jgi:hypothetical protein